VSCVAARGVDLVAAEPQERRRDPAHHRAGLVGRVPVVQQVAQDRLAGDHQIDSARVVGTPRWCIASLHTSSRSDERSTARPSARREYVVGPAPLS